MFYYSFKSLREGRGGGEWRKGGGEEGRRGGGEEGRRGGGEEGRRVGRAVERQLGPRGDSQNWTLLRKFPVVFCIINISYYIMTGPIGARAPDLLPLLTPPLDAPEGG